VGLKKEDVFAAAERLAAEGKNPTQTSVRQSLGGGSFASIGPALKEWKEAQRKELALSEIVVPESISNRMEQLKAAAWQAAMEEAERRLSAERQELHEAQEEAHAAEAEAIEAVKILERESDEQKILIKQLNKEAEELRLKFVEVREERSKAEQAHSAETARLSEKIEGLIARLEDAQAVKSEALASAEQARKEADQYKSRAAEAENAMHKAEQRIAVVNSQKEAAQEQSKERAERIVALESQYRREIEELRSDHRSAIEAIRAEIPTALTSHA
jgi:chromosome segregation ATPase